MTTIFAKCDVHCPFSATIEMIERFHEKGTQHLVGPFSSVRTRVECELVEIRDHTDQTRIHDALTLRWKARARIPVPLMRGLITVRPNGPATELRMEGTYAPPLGLLGRIFDGIIGKHIAQRTVERFLDELRDFVEREWRIERQLTDRGPSRGSQYEA